MTALPDRDQLTPGTLAGEIADHPWRIDVLPFAATDIGFAAKRAMDTGKLSL